MEIQERARKAAAYKAIDDYLKDNSVIGICNGVTVSYAVQRLAERVKNENLSLICIPGSFPARQMIIENGLVLGDVERNPKIDFTIDGADEVDEELNVTNHGGTYLSQVQIVASLSKDFIILGDYTKMIKKFGGPYKRAIAIEVISWAHSPIRMKIEEKFGGSVELRIAPKVVNYFFQGPIACDNGNYILDWDFPDDIDDWEEINTQILLIPGVVETGIYIKLATKAYFGMEDGSVKEQSRIQI